ncbi:MAG TPA: hypothetical protein VHR97_13390 [Candidatus Baltobacteraceae bacterium]|jgi:hypothetical protein|nr:hypothetical protein [Candidatus Baltobacteraceae bacterium]
MTTPGLVKAAGVLAALATLSACGGGTAVPPSSSAVSAYKYVGKTLFVNGRPVTAARLSPMPRYATMVPDHHGKKNYEYIFSYYGTYASIFNYPKSDQQIGAINGDGGQGCTNVLYGYGKKIMWNVGGPTQITEYKVPDTPIKTLSVNYSFPSSCAMNNQGDLAVGILYGHSYGPGGQVLIFKNGSGSPTVYTTPLDEEFFNGYDNKGNLFADGFTGDRSGFALVELPKGSNKFQTITTSNTVQFPGSVQWDGTYLTVFDQITNQFYQYTVSGSTALLKNTIQLTGSSDCAQTWIVKGLVYCGDAGNNNGEVFKYPAGGSPIAVFTGNFDLPLGATASRK